MNRAKKSFACSDCAYVARDGHDLRKHGARVHGAPARTIVDGAVIDTAAEGWLKPTDQPGLYGLHGTDPDTGAVVWRLVRVG